MRPKVPKKRKNHRRTISEGHLHIIRQLPCILSGLPAEAAHISYGDLQHDKPPNAMGIRADDFYAVPLAPELHRLAQGSQHHSATSERSWWRQFGIDPVEIALRLYAVGRNYQAQLAIIEGVQLTPEATMNVRSILEGKRQ